MPTKAEKLLAKGKTLESKGKRQKALDVYRDACRSEPYDPDLWTARGELARLLGHSKEAVDSLFKVCELYARGGLPAQALQTIDRLLALDAAHPGAKRLRRVVEERLDSVPPTPAASRPTPAVAPEPAPQEPAAAVAAEAAPEPELPAAPPEPDLPAGESTPVLEVEQVEPSRPLLAPPPLTDGQAGGLVREHSGAHDGALDSLSLADRLPSSLAESGSSEILLEEEGRIDVVQAIASTLTTSPLLSEFDSDLVRHLIDCGKLVHKSAEEIVFRQGDVGTSLYLILAGEISVQWESRNHSERRELARLRAGAFFGEMALLTNTGRSATVIATKSCDFLEISRKSVRELIDREPRVLKLLMRFFRARLVGTLLQTSPLFKPFTRDERKNLISRFRLRELGADQTVIIEDQKTEGLYIVLVGKLEVLQALKSSHRKVKDGGGDSDGEGLSVLLGTLSSGDVFGEMSLLDHSTASATVRTRSRSWVLLLPLGDYEDVVARHPQIKEHLTKVAAERRERNQAAREIKAGYREERLEPV